MFVIGIVGYVGIMKRRVHLMMMHLVAAGLGMVLVVQELSKVTADDRTQAPCWAWAVCSLSLVIMIERWTGGERIRARKRELPGRSVDGSANGPVLINFTFGSGIGAALVCVVCYVCSDSSC